MQELTADILSRVITPRKSHSHKGDYGRLLLIGGNENYGGAIIMATEGAINAGAGLTAVATHLINLTALHSRDPEAMFIDWRDQHLPELIRKMDVIVCGPGLGVNLQAKKVMNILATNVTEKQTVVLDASALDLISQDHQLIPAKGKLVLTPHQMEWQRLSGLRIPFQTDGANLAAFKDLLLRREAILVLKSNQTRIYDLFGQQAINSIGNPGMAIGGSGDTLAGIIGAFIAQFDYSFDTISAAVYLHSLAGDIVYKDNYVVKPTALSKRLPELMKKYCAKERKM